MSGLEVFRVWLFGLTVNLAIAGLGWAASLIRKNVTLVDSLWPLFFLASLLVYIGVTPAFGPRDRAVLLLVFLWAARLSGYLTWRNWGQREDRRYAAIRDRHGTSFWYRSLWLIFGLQAGLAWVISLPLLAVAVRPQGFGVLDAAGLTLAIAGLMFAVVADWQLTVFRATRTEPGQVLDTGLWKLCRHPNYFGEASMWWGLFLVALAAGGWWSVAGPILMTWLLVRVSGVSLLEADLRRRYPAYDAYCRQVPAFVPRLRWKNRVGGTAALLTLACLLALSPAAGQIEQQSWEFDVFLDGRKIGVHRFTLQKEKGSDHVLQSEASFDVKLWRIPLYRYRHQARERWKGGCLAGLESQTDDNGEKLQVRVERTSKGLKVEGPRGTMWLAGCVASFAYWNPRVLRQQTGLLNPQTGDYVSVEIHSLGEEQRVLNQRFVPARRERLVGSDFQIDLWYRVPDGEWVALESKLAGGRTLRYERRMPLTD